VVGVAFIPAVVDSGHIHPGTVRQLFLQHPFSLAF